MRILAPLLLLAALAGTGLYLLRDGAGSNGSESGGSALGSGGSKAQEGGASSSGAGALDRVGQGGTGGADEARRIASEGTAQDLDAADSGAPAVDLEPEPALIVGRLVDAGGQPLVGGELVLERDELGHAGDAPALARATSGAEGRFRISADDAGRATLRAGLDGYAPRTNSVVLTRGAQLDLGDVVLDAGVTLAGRVVDSRGNGVAGVELSQPPVLDGGLVILGDGARGDVVTTTDADGRFAVRRLAVGPWSLIAHHPDHPERRIDGETGAPGERVEGLLVTLADGVSISGRVLKAPADVPLIVVQAVPDADSSASASSGSGPSSSGPRRRGRPMAELRELSGSSARRAVTGPDGTFTITGLEVGARYRVAVHAGMPRTMGESRRSASVPVNAGDTGLELVWGEGATVSFSLRDAATGAPVERIEMRTGFDVPMPAFENGSPILDRAGGDVRIANLWPAPGGEAVQIEVEAPGYAMWRAADLVLEPGSRVELGIVPLEPVPRVVVDVVDAESGEPIEGAEVALRGVPEPNPGGRSIRRRVSVDVDSSGDSSVEASDVPENRGRTDADGRCVLTSMPGKQADLRVGRYGFAPWQSERITLPEVGDVEREVELGPGGEVLVTVFDAEGVAVPGVELEHHAPFDVGWMPRLGRGSSNAEGVARFERLAPGLHSFRVAPPRQETTMVFASFGGADEGPKGKGWQQLVVEPRGDHELSLILPARGSLHGTVTEGGKPLPGARLRLVSESEDNDPMAAMFGGGGPRASADGSGRYFFDAAEVGDYRLEVTHPARAMPASFDVALEPGDERRNIDLPVCVIEGRVVDDAGEPKAGVRVEAKRSAPAGPRRQAVRVMMISTDDGDGGGETVMAGGIGDDPGVLTDEDGRFTLRGVAWNQDLVVEAKLKGFDTARSESVKLAPGETKSRLELTLRQGGVIRLVLEGELAGEAGLLAVARFQGEPSTDPVAEVVGDPEVYFRDLAPGEWEVSVRRMSPSADEDDLPEPMRVQVRAGEESELRMGE